MVMVMATVVVAVAEKKKDNVTTVNKTLAAESIQNVVKRTIEKYYNKNKS